MRVKVILLRCWLSRSMNINYTVEDDSMINIPNPSSKKISSINDVTTQEAGTILQILQFREFDTIQILLYFPRRPWDQPLKQLPHNFVTTPLRLLNYCQQHLEWAEMVIYTIHNSLSLLALVLLHAFKVYICPIFRIVSCVWNKGIILYPCLWYRNWFYQMNCRRRFAL